MSSTKCKVFDDSWCTNLDSKAKHETITQTKQPDQQEQKQVSASESPKPTFTQLMNIQLSDQCDSNNSRSNGYFTNTNNTGSLMNDSNIPSITTADVSFSTVTSRTNSFDTSDGISKGYSYTNSYMHSFQLDLNDPRRDTTFFLQDTPIHIEIVAYEEEPSLVLLHTNVYTINISHGLYTWTIKRKYKNFLKLYEAYAVFKTKLNIRNAAAAHLTPSLTNQASTDATGTIANDPKKFKSSDHFKLLFKSIASDFAQARAILEKFLQDVLDHKTFRNHTETLKFLEVSHLSFISDLGIKNKEGIIKKRSQNIRCFSSMRISFLWTQRWLIVKDTFVAYLDAKTGEIRSVLLVDHNFKVSSGYQQTGEKYGLLVENLSKNIFVKCYNEKRAQEWRIAIMKMIQGTGSLFRYQQRFKSFAPIREESLVKWFVDGQDYMESIADSIESAQEEIFITGFFLSPEIYLKRPVIVGDKWRLDKLLQRKAEQGVKVYVLIYKEIEITLPINSAYSKRILTLSHKNIKVLRHPDHINEPNKFLSIMWAHHEKLVIVDQSVAYFGGLDLCYGRWDNHLHKLTDLGSVLPEKQSSLTFLPSGSTSSLRTKQPKTTLVKPRASTSISDFQPSTEIPSYFRTNKKAAQIPDSVNSLAITRLTADKTDSIIESNELADPEPREARPTTTSNNKHLNRFKVLRMLSSPSRPVALEQEILSRNFLIDNMTDYYNNFIKKDITEKDFLDNHEDEDSEDEVTQESRFLDNESMENRREDRFVNKLFRTRLKRSKSLEIKPNQTWVLPTPEPNQTSKAPLVRSNECNLPIKADNLYQTPNSNPFKIIKDSLSDRLKSNHHSLKLLHRDYKELTIFNKLNRIKQFKESLKRYALNKYQDSSQDSSFCFEDENITLRDMPSKEDLFAFNAFKNRTIGPSRSGLEGNYKLWIGKDYCNFIFKDVVNVHSPFQDSINRKETPRMPWHDIAGCVAGAAARDIARHFIQRWNYIKVKKVKNDPSYVQLIPKAYKQYTIPRHIVQGSTQCRVQAIRSVSKWSAGIARTESSIHTAMLHLIRTAKHYIYIENQFFISQVECDRNGSGYGNNIVKNEIAQCLYERILKAHEAQENFKVYVFLPLIPGYAGEYGKSSGILLHTITHYNNTSINSLIKKLADSGIDALNYICFFGLRTWSELNNSLITELIYVHSKLLIVDDRACIIGSANVNDRSLLGNRDSEVALYIEDTQFIPGRLNKQPCQVGKFTSTLRLRLFREFLGEFPCCHNIDPIPNNKVLSLDRQRKMSDTLVMSLKHPVPDLTAPTIDLTDPCSDDFYKQVLLKYAAQNTRIFDMAFKVIPCDYVSNFEQLKEYNKQPSLNQTDKAKAKIELMKVKGYIVLFPNQFLNRQDLTPPLGTKEKLLPTKLWT